MTGTVFIGDVHGDRLRLDRLLRHGRMKGRCLVFLGDIVGRGPDSRSVVERVLELRSSSREFTGVKILRGNHEQALLDFLGNGDFASYVLAGGLPTIRSYATPVFGSVHDAFRNSVPHAHLELFSQAPAVYEDSEVFACHAGVSASDQFPRDEHLLVHGREDYLRLGARGFRKLVVCGHYVQRDGHAFHGDNLVCLETGAGTKWGRLSALLMPERVVLAVE